MAAYYNENDPKAAAWLRELIKADAIAPGEVDGRSIEDVTADDIRPFRQAHFFAGIGGWSYALRLAGWPDDRPVWTGSCPCQPFSAAGKGRGFADERHLWPAWFHLIDELRPAHIVGEQVASPDGLAWFDLVQADLEGASYAVAGADLCAAGVGAPHIRQRLYWVGELANDRSERRLEIGSQSQGSGGGGGAEGLEQRSVHSGAISMADSSSTGLEIVSEQQTRGQCQAVERSGTAGEHSGPEWLQRSRQHRQLAENGLSGFWANCDWIPCRDGKARPVESGAFPLAHGVSGRVGRLRGYGNAIVAPLAAEFIRAVMECTDPRLLEDIKSHRHPVPNRI